jgi:hypothetical protein
MALLFLGQTECPICGDIIEDRENAYLFPPFISNTKDKMYEFNDAAFHISCLRQHPLGNLAIAFSDELIFKTRPQNRICIVGGNEIKSFDDYIFISLLTSNEREDLYKFNFITLDRNNLKIWSDRIEFIDVATKFKQENKWGDFGEFKYLDNLIESIRV